jgi:hypothetical protein
LIDDLKNLLNSCEFSDIEFQVEDKLVKAHRNILAVRSNYFRSLLCESLPADRLNKPIHIKNIGYEAFKLLLYYLYTSQIEKNAKCETICELMRACSWFNLDDLDKACLNHIECILNTENAISMLTFSLKPEPVLTNVGNLCLKFIVKNFNSIIQKAEFKNLPQSILIKISQFYAEHSI